MRLIPKFIAYLALFWLTGFYNGITFGQENGQPLPTPSSSCSRDSALDIVQQQVAFSKTFDNSVQRITVLIRAADLLWAFRQAKARAAFAESFDLAVLHFKEKGDEPSREGRLPIGMPDQRYTVIGAIAKRDNAWAKKLTDQMLKEEHQETQEKPTKDTQRELMTAARLLTMAGSLFT